MGLYKKKGVKQSTQTDKVSTSGNNSIPEPSKKSPRSLRNFTGVFDIMSRGMKYFASVKKEQAPKSVSNLVIQEHCPEPTKSYETDSSCTSSQTRSSVTTQIVIPKTISGIGFTSKDTELVRVNRVKDGGSAHDAGLRRGDVICAINGEDVRHEKSTTIARIFRRSVTQNALDIYRARSEIPFSSQSCSSLHNKIKDATSSYHERPLPAIPEQTFAREANATKTLMSSLKWHRNDAYESHLSPQANVVNAEISANWHPDISQIQTEYPCDFANIYEEIGEISNDWSDSGAESSGEMSQSRMASYDPNTSWNRERIHNVTI